MKEVFELHSKELLTLQTNDPQLAKLIGLIGEISFDIRQDRFSALIGSIIGQQLSVKAASTISSRFFKLLNNEVNPSTIEKLSDDTMREAGLSKQKISYIRDLCAKVNTSEVDLLTIDNVSDEEVIELLTKVKGIGIWTAEMFLIFSLSRKNILSLGDVGLQRACKWLYNSSNDVDKKALLKEKGKSWTPFSSIASLYLWAAIDEGFVENFKTIDEAISSKKSAFRHS